MKTKIVHIVEAFILGFIIPYIVALPMFKHIGDFFIVAPLFIVFYLIAGIVNAVITSEAGQGSFLRSILFFVKVALLSMVFMILYSYLFVPCCTGEGSRLLIILYQILQTFFPMSHNILGFLFGLIGIGIGLKIAKART